MLMPIATPDFTDNFEPEITWSDSHQLSDNRKAQDKIYVIQRTDNSKTNNIIVTQLESHEFTSTSHEIDSSAISELARKIKSFGQLSENWDGYDGISPNPSTTNDAIQLLKMIPESTLPDRVGVSSDGEISLIWDNNDLFADFGVLGDKTFCFFINNKNKKLYGDEIPLFKGIPEEAKELLNA